MLKIKNIVKIGTIVVVQGNIEVLHKACNLECSVPKKIPVVFHYGSSYDYHFIIRELAEEFEHQFTCLGENTEKCIPFSVPIKKQLQK